MKMLRSIVAGTAGLACLYFSLINITDVPFYVMPFREVMSINLSFVILSFFCIGFLSGALIVWLGGHDRRKAVRLANNKLAQNEKELNEYKAQSADKDFNLLQNQG